MKKLLIAKLALAGTVGLAAAMVSGSADAAGCNQCHTMHNSQNGDPMRFDSTQAEPLPKLLRGDCIYCHTGRNTAGEIGVTAPPKVIADGAGPVYSGLFADGATTGTTLAGGDFYWVDQVGGDAFGHNVAPVTGVDGDLGNTPPGGSALTGQLQCAGTLGCHGLRSGAGNDDPLTALNGAHHSAHNNHADGLIDGLSVGTSFRYLMGVLGGEDSDWQFSESTTDHNQYVGVIRTVDTASADATSINGLCAQCHPSYHNTADGGAGNDGFGINDTATVFSAGEWIRHPTDYDMDDTAATTEYAGYDTYEPETPVGKLVGNLGTAAAAGNDVSAGSRIVLCVSCHRAHGSPYADLLRWDYSTMDVGVGRSNGCMNCHTAK